eukprot:CAMPEP_0194278922 /NCGR_PEP_ID=MMETSP0169-20130528/12710_1 /TAXON_ID=218684 /ORGANISM="Corethron pennatum, Strain L29A3" /LENGTH=113 /DNA_ID=CAMNT_0039023239 /DNA_START=63 /DNA_END=404 /DNA_ORIENTATION=-
MSAKNTIRIVFLIAAALSCSGFVIPQQAKAFAPVKPSSPSFDKSAAFAKKEKSKYTDEDFAAISSRDMTREEMLDLNAQNEEIMNAELGMMTGFSLALSAPLFYLCWVAFHSD